MQDCTGFDRAMTQAIALPPDLSRQSVALARALTAAIRVWGLYPPDHPSVVVAVRRLVDAIRDAAAGSAIAFGVTPSTLMLGSQPLPPDQPVADAARLLHDHDILRISFFCEMAESTAASLLTLLCSPPEEVRAAGGPAVVWAAQQHATVGLEQIDYQKILEDREVDEPRSRKDDVWRSLVTTIARGEAEFNEEQQRRLLAISGSAGDIRSLATDVIEPQRNIDGSPLITTQAATVLAVFRHMTGIVKVNEPECLPDVIQRIVAATATLDPHVVAQLMQTEDRAAGDDMGLVSRIAAAFDDDKVAELLATALGRDGKATVRLAQVFDTLAPDQQRKQRVLSMTRSLLDHQTFGKSSQFSTVWSSMETLLLSYDETPYVSEAYRVSLEGVGTRGQMLAGRDMPTELPQWLETLEQDNVRALSVTLVTDLLRIEDRLEYAEALVQDVLALVEDLLLAGDFELARVALRVLRESTSTGVAPAAARAALTTCGESLALREAAALLGDFDEPTLALFAGCCELIGPTSVHALLPAFHSEDETTGVRRARDLVQSFGTAAVPAVSTLVDNDRWFVQRHAAIALAATKSAAAVPALQTLLRKPDPRVLRAAVSALAGIEDPKAARALQTVLRASAGSRRLAVMEALVAERDDRVVPMLDQLLTECDPFGEDRTVVLDTLNAVAQFGDERAVNGVTTVMRRTRWFRRATARAFKRAAVQALVAIDTAAAAAALDEGQRRGDRLLRKVIREERK